MKMRETYARTRSLKIISHGEKERKAHPFTTPRRKKKKTSGVEKFP
jgi:hypothetical protein